MGKKEKGAAKSTESHEELAKRLAELKKKKGEAWKNLSGFRLKNKFKKGEKFKDKALQKEYEALEKTYGDLKAEYDKVEAAEKAVRPAKERAVKYDYPADCDTADKKKKFRASQRAAAKKGEKAEKKAEKKADKSEKKKEKTEPAAEPKKDKAKDKKKKASKED